jgi:putative peptidoglycan lipid II flippase
MTSNQEHSIFKAASLIAFFTLLSRLVGLYRDRLFASHFGPGDLLDAYYAAFRIPDLIFNLLVLGTLSAAFIPVFTEYFVEDEKEANKVANTILNISFLAISALCLVLYFFVPQLVNIVAPGFEGEKYQMTVAMTKVFLLSPIIFTVSNVFTSMLHALKRFLYVSIAPIIYNFGIIFGIVYLYPRYGINGLAWGVIIGALGHLLIQLPEAIRSGYSFRPVIQLNHPAMQKFTKLFLPRILGIESSQVSLLIASIIGSTLMAGTISIFNLANNLQAVAIGMFGISFAIAAFPNLSEAYAEKNEKKFSDTLLRTTLHVLYFIIPISVLLILLRAQIVRVLFGTGQFDWEATRLTSNTLGIFAISIFAQSLAPLFARSFYARHNTVTPVIISLFSLLLNGVASFAFGRAYGVLGLVLGFSLASIVNASILFLVLRSRLQFFDTGILVRKVSKIIVSSLAMGVVTYLLLNLYSYFIDLNTTFKVFAQAAFAGTVGILVYLLLTAAFGISETNRALGIVKRAFTSEFLLGLIPERLKKDKDLE